MSVLQRAAAINAQPGGPHEYEDIIPAADLAEANSTGCRTPWPPA